MSISKEITVWCDHPDCPTWAQEAGSVASALRADLRHRGWATLDGQDYCPKHAVEHGAPKPRARKLKAGEAWVEVSTLAELATKCGRDLSK